MVFGVLFPLEPLWVSPLQSEPLMIPLNELLGELLTPISDVLDHVPTREAVEHELPCEWFASSSVATEELAPHSHSGNTNVSGNHWHYEFNNTPVAFNNAANNLNSSQCVSAQTNASRGEAYAMLTSTGEANVGRSGYSGNHSHTIQTNSTGSGMGHENRMPYQVINRWKRTA